MALIPRPTLVADFTQEVGLLLPFFTLTRASIGTYVDRAGVLKTGAANAFRQMWDPDTGECLGALVEPSRTNLALWSEDLSNAAWTKTNATITANSVAAPDGATTADTITVNAASGNVSQAATTTAGNDLAVSVYAKPAGSNFLHMQVTDGTNTVTVWFNLSTGAVGTTTAGGATCAYSIAKMKRHALTGWYRCTLVVTTATSTSYTLKVSAAAADNAAPANTNSIYVWGAQIESATLTGTTSYIATTSASVTRSIDTLSIASGVNFLNTFGNEGTYLIEGSMMYAPRNGNNYMFVLSNAGSTTDEISVNIPSGGIPNAAIRETVAGATYSQSHGAAIAEDQLIKMAVAYKANSANSARDGIVGTADTSVTVPTPTPAGTKFASRASGSFAAAWAFRRFIYWPRRLSDADLAALTA